jgi:hypothetical protein
MDVGVGILSKSGLVHKQGGKVAPAKEVPWLSAGFDFTLLTGKKCPVNRIDRAFAAFYR